MPSTEPDRRILRALTPSTALTVAIPQRIAPMVERRAELYTMAASMGFVLADKMGLKKEIARAMAIRMRPRLGGLVYQSAAINLPRVPLFLMTEMFGTKHLEKDPKTGTPPPTHTPPSSLLPAGLCRVVPVPTPLTWQ